MFKFQNLKHFLNTLYQNRSLLNMLFEKRNFSLQYRDVADGLTHQTDGLNKLIDSKIVYSEGGVVGLEEGLTRFFETFLEVRKELNTGMVRDLIEEIEQNKGYYLEERNYKNKEVYLQQIKKSLKNAGQLILNQVAILREKIEQVYKTESNLKIKLAKLTNYRTKRDTIEILEQQLRHLLQDDIFFGVAADEELRVIVLVVKHILAETQKNLLSIQENIIKYLNKAQEQSQGYEKLQKLKHLKDQHELNTKSNIAIVIAKENSLFLEGKIGVQTRLSLGYLETDQGYHHLLKAAKKQHNKPKKNIKLAMPIPEKLLNVTNAVEFRIDLEHLKNAYFSQGGELFSFIQRYDFGQEVSYSKRLTLFCKMISLFGNMFTFSTTVNQTPQGTEYLMVYLKEQK